MDLDRALAAVLGSLAPYTAADWSVSAGVLARLFPDAPGGDPVAVLLWCTGRIALPDRPRRTRWILRASVN
jgi:hypothetical protein